MYMLCYDSAGQKVASVASKTVEATNFIGLFNTSNTFLQTKLVLVETRVMCLSDWWCCQTKTSFFSSMFIEIDISFYQLMLYFHNMLCGVDKSCSDGEFVW
jgi:hypothetical protein